MKRTCNKCNILKSLDEFYKLKHGKFGRQSCCVKCMLVDQNKYNNSIKEIRKQRAHKYYINNKEKIDNRNKEWIIKNPDKKTAINILYLKKNREKISSRQHDYYLKNKPEIISATSKYKKNRCKIDPIFKLKLSLRNRVYLIFKSKCIKKNKKTEYLLGTSFEIAKLHIERQFKKGMCWSNHGKWHIDHIIPLSSSKTEEELILLCHYTNLQPLWGSENMFKRNKILPVQVRLTL